MNIKKNLVIGLAMACGLFSQANAHGDGNYVHSDLLSSLQKGDKAALLMVHFGTTHDDTRQLTIDAINQKAKELFPEFEIREAYTSRIIMARLPKEEQES